MSANQFDASKIVCLQSQLNENGKQNQFVQETESQRHNFQNYNSDSVSENWQDSPIIDSLTKKVRLPLCVTNTKFTHRQCFKLFNVVSNALIIRFSRARGKRNGISVTDWFFITLSFMNPGGTWNDILIAFWQKKSTLERSLNNFIDIVSPVLNNIFLKDRACEWSIGLLKQQKQQFNNFPFCIYSINARFQYGLQAVSLTMTPSRISVRSTNYTASKSKISVLPNGLSICASRHRNGVLSDISIFRKSIPWHKSMFQKSEEDKHVEEEVLNSKYRQDL